MNGVELNHGRFNSLTSTATQSNTAKRTPLPILFIAIIMMVMVIFMVPFGKLTIMIIAFVCCAFLPLSFFLRFALNEITAGRVGIKNEQVVIQKHNHPPITLIPEKTVYAKNFISANNTVVYTKNARGYLFEPIEFEHHILSRLKEATYLGPIDAIRHLLKQRDKLTIWGLLLFISCTTLIITFELFFRE